jgi:large subunit ribosomal protein L35
VLFAAFCRGEEWEVASRQGVEPQHGPVAFLAGSDRPWFDLWKRAKEIACLELYRLPIVRALFKERQQVMRRPKPPKTRKAVAKRFKVTATGKVMRSHAGKRHLLQSKGPKRRRALRAMVQVSETDAYRIKQNLPFSH